MSRPIKPAPDPAASKTYITTDPDGLGFSPFVANGDNDSILDLLNEPGAAVFVPRSSKALLSFSAATGIFAKILTGTKSADAATAGLCEAARLLVTREDTELDLADPDHLAMLHALAASRTITGDPALPASSLPDVTAAGTDLDAIRGFCSKLVGKFEFDHDRLASIDDVRAALRSP